MPENDLFHQEVASAIERLRVKRESLLKCQPSANAAPTAAENNPVPEWAIKAAEKIVDEHIGGAEQEVLVVARVIAANAPQAAVSAAPVPEAEITDDPYFTEVDDNGCPHCSAGRTWCVVGPDGDRGSTSYEDEDAAIDLADKLNDAFALGRSSHDNPALLSALQLAERAISDLLEQFTAYADNNWLGTGKWRSRNGLDEARDNGRQALSTIRALRPQEPAQNGEER